MAGVWRLAVMPGRRGAACRAPTPIRGVMVALATVWNAVAAQSPARLTGTFVETIRSEVISQSGPAEHHRTVIRTAQFTAAPHGDTLVVTADTISLTESTDNARRTIDVDAVIGARWKLLLPQRGRSSVIESPVVPSYVADVSNIGTAMDDFFPVEPPRLSIGAKATDSAGRSWQRLADSSGVGRYHYSGVRRTNTRSDDSVRVDTDENTSESSEVAWAPARGPMAWTRHIQTNVTTRFAGRTVRAQVDQRIAVRRTA